MNKYFEKLYYIDEDGEFDPISLAITCWEQMQYFSLKQYESDYCIDYNYIFCNDINLELSLKDQRYIVRKTSHIFYEDLYHITTYENEKEPLRLIEDILDSGKAVAVRTAFNMLPPYNWYHENSNDSHSFHYFMLIGHEDNYVYFIDSPLLLNKECNRSYSKNPTISILDKDSLNNALNEFAIIKTIEINFLQLNMYKTFDKLLNTIMEEFFSVLPNGNNKTYIGKNALIKLIDLLKKQDDKILKCTFFESHFDAHIMFSSRGLLKMCLKTNNIYSNKKNLKEVINALEKSEKKWLNLKYIILKHNNKPIKDFDKKIINFMEEILLAEETFFMELNKLISD